MFIISEIKPDNGRKTLFLVVYLHSTPPLGVPVGILPQRLVRKNWNGAATLRWKKFYDRLCSAVSRQHRRV